MLPRSLFLVLLAGRPVAGYDIQHYSVVIPGLVAGANAPGHGLLLSELINESAVGVRPVRWRRRPVIVICPMTTTQQRELASIAVSGYGGKGQRALLAAEQGQVENSRRARMLEAGLALHKSVRACKLCSYLVSKSTSGKELAQ
jgi:hypothetical protein